MCRIFNKFHVRLHSTRFFFNPTLYNSKDRGQFEVERGRAHFFAAAPLPPKPSVSRRRDACWQSPYHISARMGLRQSCRDNLYSESQDGFTWVFQDVSCGGFGCRYWVVVRLKVGRLYRCLWQGVSGGGGCVFFSQSLRVHQGI